MKIFLITQTLNNKTGTGVFVGNLIRGVQSQNKEISFFILSKDNHIKFNFLGILKNWAYLRKSLRESDLIHAIDGYPYGVLAYLLNIGISKPLIITMVGSGSIKNLKGWGLMSFMLRRCYRKVEALTAISNFVALEVKKLLPELEIKVINPGVDYEFYSQVNESNTTELGNYIVTQGEFKRRKGYSEMLPIIKRVLDKYSNLKFVIVGDTTRNLSYQEELYSSMDNLGIRDRIIIKSNLSREELRSTYSQASLYFSLPINIDGDVEGFGMTIVEAGATGVPAVVGRGSGADDAVLNESSGFLVEGDNSEEVLEKICSLIDNPSLHKRMSEGAREKAKLHSPIVNGKEYLALYTTQIL